VSAEAVVGSGQSCLFVHYYHPCASLSSFPSFHSTISPVLTVHHCPSFVSGDMDGEDRREYYRKKGRKDNYCLLLSSDTRSGITNLVSEGRESTVIIVSFHINIFYISLSQAYSYGSPFTNRRGERKHKLISL